MVWSVCLIAWLPWLTGATHAIDSSFHLLVGLRQRTGGPDALRAKLAEVSNPRSTLYRKYLSNEEITEIVAPEHHAVAKVTEHLAPWAMKMTLSANRDWIEADVLLKDLRRVFPAREGSDNCRTGGDSNIVFEPCLLPPSVAQHVEVIAGLGSHSKSAHMFHLESHIMSTDSVKTVAREFPPPAVFSSRAWDGDPLLLWIMPHCSGSKHVPMHTTVGNCSEVNALKPISLQGVLTGHKQTSPEHVSWASGQLDANLCKSCAAWKAEHPFVMGVQVFHLCRFFHQSDEAIGCLIRVNRTKSMLGINCSLSVTTRFVDGSVSTAARLANIFLQPAATPQYLKELYHVPLGLTGQEPSNRQAVVEFLEQYAAPRDLHLYLQHFGFKHDHIQRVFGPNYFKVPRLGCPSSLDPFVNVSGTCTPGLEAELDIEVIMAMAYNVSTEFWSYGGRRNNSQQPNLYNQEPFLTWLVDLQNTQQPPLVFSVSYGDDERQVPLKYAERCDSEFVKAGLRGISILISSGDNGTQCTNLETKTSASIPGYPAGSPFVTSVGGTQTLVAPLRSQAEEAVSNTRTGSLITSGGGFMYHSDQPSWQRRVVQSYVDRHLRSVPPHYFNRFGRAYPDISALATYYPIVFDSYVRNRTWTPVWGTSASTPVAASLISLVNDALIQRGEPPLGFMNPLLYSLANDTEVFFDVTYGSTSCGEDPQTCCPYNAFPAAPGWDAATGLGTLNFSALLSRVLHVKPEDQVKSFEMSAEHDRVGQTRAWKYFGVVSIAAGSAVVTIFSGMHRRSGQRASSCSYFWQRFHSAPSCELNMEAHTSLLLA